MSMTQRIEDAVTVFLRGCIEDRLFPGCAVGIVAGGRTFIVTAGNCTYASDSPLVGEHTVYDVASITKSVPTSCLALKFIEERMMTLHSPLVDFIPEYEGRFRDEIRIVHLLTHTLDFDFRMSDKKDLLGRKHVI